MMTLPRMSKAAEEFKALFEQAQPLATQAARAADAAAPAPAPAPAPASDTKPPPPPPPEDRPENKPEDKPEDKPKPDRAMFFPDLPMLDVGKVGARRVVSGADGVPIMETDEERRSRLSEQGSAILAEEDRREQRRAILENIRALRDQGTMSEEDAEASIQMIKDSVPPVEPRATRAEVVRERRFPQRESSIFGGVPRSVGGDVVAPGVPEKTGARTGKSRDLRDPEVLAETIERLQERRRELSTKEAKLRQSIGSSENQTLAAEYAREMVGTPGRLTAPALEQSKASLPGGFFRNLGGTQSYRDTRMLRELPKEERAAILRGEKPEGDARTQRIKTMAVQSQEADNLRRQSEATEELIKSILALREQREKEAASSE